MKTIRSAALVIVILLVAAFGMLSQQTGGKPSSSLVGAWKLTTVEGKDPVTISIKSWRIEFREQGKWEYSGTMAGEYEGTKLSGSGTWTLEGKQLEYTAGTNKGQTVVYLERGSLSPDPVLRLHGKDPVETQYVRAESR